MPINLEVKKLTTRYQSLAKLESDIDSALQLMYRCYLNGNTIFTCGNGGSAADSEHIVGELMKGFKSKRTIKEEHIQAFESMYPNDSLGFEKNLQQGIPSVSLVSNSALTSAIINDGEASYVFAQQVFGIGKKGDVLIAISTSGNSENVVKAAKVANVLGLKVIVLSGATGGKLSELATVSICVPSSDVAEIQELHLPIYHCLCLGLEKLCFG
jgi:D-sedoheptulose 7-phosphate isomerase